MQPSKPVVEPAPFAESSAWTKTRAPTTGFYNGVAEGRQVFVAGQIGWNARQEIVSDDFVAQVEQALRNVVAELGATEREIAEVVSHGCGWRIGRPPVRDSSNAPQLYSC